MSAGGQDSMRFTVVNENPYKMSVTRGEHPTLPTLSTLWWTVTAEPVEPAGAKEFA
jgi:hypothetical protein